MSLGALPAGAMAFIENGRVVERRSLMRVGTISDMIWGFLNTIYCFFHCMLSVCLSILSLPSCLSSNLSGLAKLLRFIFEA